MNNAARFPGNNALFALSARREVRLRVMVNRYVRFVAQVLRHAGSPASEIEDDVQRTFIALARRLDDVLPGAEGKFLLQVARSVAAHSRRTFARRREVFDNQLPASVESLATPERLIELKHARQVLERVLGEMEPELRAVFVLFEYEELPLSEIAGVLGIPRGTVASRLRRARIQFRRCVFAIRRIERTRASPLPCWSRSAPSRALGGAS